MAGSYKYVQYIVNVRQCSAEMNAPADHHLKVLSVGDDQECSAEEHEREPQL